MSHRLSLVVFTAVLVLVLGSVLPHVAFAVTASVSVPAATTQGVPFTVTWNSTGATSCTVTGPGFSASGLSGSQSTTQTTPGTKNYSIVCSSGSCTWNQIANDQDCFVSSNPSGCFQGGTCTPSGSTCETGSVKMLAGEPVCLNHTTYQCGGACTSANQTASTVVSTPPPPTVTVSATPATVAYGSPTTISWSSTNATSCFESSGVIATGGAVSGSVSVTPPMNTTYTFTCTGYGGSGSGSKTVTVTGVPAPTATLTASPGTVTLGSSATLTWSSTNASSCTGTGFPTGNALSGSITVTPATNTTYSLSCTGQGGSGTASVGVGVIGGGATSVIVFDNHDGYMHQYVDPDASANGGIANPSVSGIYAGATLERNRTCVLVDPTSFPTAFSTRSYNSPDNNSVLKFNGNTWSQVGANGNNIKYSHLTCATNAKPDTSLTANGSATGITVASGTAVNLTWLSQYGQIRQGTCSAQNFSTYTWVPGYWQDQWDCVDSCGSGGNVCAIAPQQKDLAGSVLRFLGFVPETAHALVNGCARTQVWVPGSYQNVPFGGTTTVNPTVTTTYTYTCANAIGSTSKSITVTVPTGPQCSDGLDNDSDGTCDNTGCTVNGVVLPADPGCMSPTDTTEDPNPPPPPVLSSAVCAPNGTSVTLDWSDTSTNGYYVRVQKPVSGVCPGTMVTAAWDATVCIPNPDLVSPSTYALSPIAPGTAYSYWVHSRTATGEWSAATSGSFTCAPSVPLTASCSASPISATTGQTSVRWTATPSGGTGTYTYSWSGTDGLSGTGSFVDKVYSTPGSKTASVTVTSGGTLITVACNADANPGDGTVTVTNPAPPSVVCTVSDSNPSPGQVVTYTATPANGASGPYTWVPSDPSMCVAGTGNTKNCTFTGFGANYAMTVTATGTGSPSDTCPAITTKSPTVSISANPTRLNPGNTSVITWSADQVGSCTVTGTDGYTSGILTGPTIPSANVTRTITKQTAYTIACDSGVTKTVIVNIPPNFDEF